MDAYPQPSVTTDIRVGRLVAQTAGAVAAAAGAGGDTPLVGRRPEIRLDERDVAADLGAIDPAATPSVERSDGQPGYTEQLAGAVIVDGSTPQPSRPPVIDNPHTPPPRRNPTSGRILSEADRIIHGERAEQYGPAEESFARIAALWSVHLGITVDAYDVGVLMVLMKAARARTDLKDDTAIDIAGYGALLPRLAVHSGRLPGA